MTEPINGKPNPRDLLAQMREHGANIYRAAYERGTSLSGYLEEVDPSSAYPNSSLDAFGRLMAAAGIRTCSIPRAGVYASTYEQFAKHPEARALLPEWWARQWRAAQNGRQVNTRSMQWDYNDNTPGSWARPYADDPMGMWDQQIAPAIPLSELVAITVPIDRPDYRAHYLTYAAGSVRTPRVGPGAEVPLAKLTSGDRTIEAHKYGRALEATYEQLQFQILDEIAMTIQMMSVQAEVDKVVAALAILISGDGNSGTAAATYNLTSANGSNPAMDSNATAGTLSLKGWLNFNMLWDGAYLLTTILVQNAVALQLRLLDAGTGNRMLADLAGGVGFPRFRGINPEADMIAMGRTSSAPSLKIVGFDRRMALKRLTVIGANIQEVERFTRNQTEVLTMTEMEGFAIMDGNTVKTLDINA